MAKKNDVKKNTAAWAAWIEVKKALFLAHGLEWTEKDAASDSRLPVGYIEIDGLRWPLWKSEYCLDPSPVFVSDGMTGKMAGIPAVSTDCRMNPACIARMKDGNSICAHCFAETTLNRYTAAGEHATINTLLLSRHLVPVDLLPVFGNVCFARIESTGDLSGVLQAVNYLNMIKKNRRVVFGWWTKNTAFLDAAIDQIGGKPKNMIYIQSACALNRREDPRSAHVDKVFTVYDPRYIADHDIAVNCGARSCMRCQKCYDTENKVLHISEQLK